VALIFVPDLGSVFCSLRWRHVRDEPSISRLSKINSEILKDIRYLVDPISFNPSPDEILDDIRRAVPHNSYHYCFLINDGIRLLRKHVPSHSRIVVMNYTNPFSFPLGLPGSKGDRLDWLYGQTFNNSLYPSPQEVFKEASLIMIRTGKFNRPYEMMRIYFPYVEKKLRKIDESDLWILYGENNSSGLVMH
jgi:hypothetical protein